MLKISLYTRNGNEMNEIRLHDILLSEDYKTVTFVAEDDCILQQNDTVKLYSYSYDDWTDMDVSVERFNVMGTFVYDTRYEVLSDNDSECKYIKFHDNRYYYNRNNYNNEFSGKTKIFIDDASYPIQTDTATNSEYVMVKEKYFITSDTQTLTDGTICEIFIERIINPDDSIDTSGSFITIGGVVADVDDLVVYPYPKPFANIIFNNDSSFELMMEGAACAISVPYVVYNGEEYEIQNKFADSSEQYVNIGNGLSGTVRPYLYEYDEDKGKFQYKETTFPSDGYSNCDTFAQGMTLMLKVNDAENTALPIFFKSKDGDIGTKLYLYLEGKNTDISARDRIVATTANYEPRYVVLTRHIKFNENDEKEYVDAIVHNGKFYDKRETDENGNPFYYVKIDDREYEFHFLPNSTNEGYIDYDGTIMYLKISQSINDVISEYRSQAPSGDDSRIRIEFANEEPIGLPNISYPKEKIEVMCNNLQPYFTYDIETYVDGSNPIFAYVPYENLLTRKLYAESSEQIIISNPVYGITRYDVVQIEDKNYQIYNSQLIYGNNQHEDDETYQYIMLDKPETYVFTIDGIEGSNKLMCSPIIDGYVDVDIDTTQEYDELAKGICYDVATNYSMYYFSKEHKFSPYKERLDFSLFNSDVLNQPLHLNNVRLFKSVEYFSIPLLTSQENYATLFQENYLEKQFVDREVAKSINEYVDMDKDIYYPFYKVGDEMKEVNGIYFNLHFRTRTFDGWTINEDYTRLNGDNTDERLLPSFNEANTNWFCFDYYSGATNYSGYSDNGRTSKQTYGEFDIDKNPSEAWKHSDLLYFLNFTNDDVYYQKKKLSHSFIRLLFYDSNNPANQSLLYQATIWYDYSKAYKKFIDNHEINDYFDFATNSIKKGVGVACEPYANDVFTFDDNIRLDSQFYVKNRYSMKDSAEGFYLHMFKNLLDGTCQRTIYMKVMFNHAGEGKSCLFMLPHSKHGDTIVPWEYNTENVNELKAGVSIEDVFDTMFIPITLEYDVEKDRFMYYLSENVGVFDEDNNLTFNLFEIKMKDESNKKEDNP